MTRRWFLGTIGSALVGAYANTNDVKLVESFHGNFTQTDGDDLTIDLPVLQDMISRTPMASIGFSIDGMKVWNVLEDPGVLTVTVKLPYGGAVSFIEKQAGRTLATVAANNIPGARGTSYRATIGRWPGAGSPDGTKFLWRIGKLPLPDVMVDYIPAFHPLGKWVRQNNKLVLTRNIAKGVGQGDVLPPGTF